MKNVILCGHTGSINRGCEAIVRSTCDILNTLGINDISVISFDSEYDRFLGLDKIAKIIQYPKHSFLERIYATVNRKILGNKLIDGMIIYKKILKDQNTNSIVFNIGGDIYCCSNRPYLSYALNKVTSNKNISNIFWGCSVDDRVLTDMEMCKDVNRYSYIVTRESFSKNNIYQTLTDKNKLKYACDPAFTLSTKEVDLPQFFLPGNTLGFNVSPLVFKDCNNDEDIMYKNIRTLFNYIIEKTDLNICLVPHVYNVVENKEDIKVLKTIYSWYKDTERVSIVDKELSCCELKYIISQCRFFIGARTHATIAAYSSCVPALALSYSVKSLGLAVDIFGDEKQYAMDWKKLKTENDLKDRFIEVLIKNEKNMRGLLEKTMPKYKKTIINTAKELLESIHEE